jgi:hypothetical protein
VPGRFHEQLQWADATTDSERDKDLLTVCLAVQCAHQHLRADELGHYLAACTDVGTANADQS